MTGTERGAKTDSELMDLARTAVALRDRGPCTSETLAAAMGLDEDTVRERLQTLATSHYRLAARNADGEWEYAEPSAFRKAMWALQQDTEAAADADGA